MLKRCILITTFFSAAKVSICANFEVIMVRDGAGLRSSLLFYQPKKVWWNTGFNHARDQEQANAHCRKAIIREKKEVSPSKPRRVNSQANKQLP